MCWTFDWQIPLSLLLSCRGVDFLIGENGCHSNVDSDCLGPITAYWWSLAPTWWHLCCEKWRLNWHHFVGGKNEAFSMHDIIHTFHILLIHSQCTRLKLGWNAYVQLSMYTTHTHVHQISRKIWINIKIWDKSCLWPRLCLLMDLIKTDHMQGERILQYAMGHTLSENLENYHKWCLNYLTWCFLFNDTFQFVDFQRVQCWFAC